MRNKIILTVLKKELIDLFRDKKTIIMGILIPVLMIPVMYGILGKVMSSETKSATENIKIIVNDAGKSKLYDYIKNQKGIKLVDIKNIDQAVKDGKASVGIDIPADFEEKLSQGENVKLDVTYDNTSQQSSTSYAVVNSYIQQYSKEIVKERLQKKGIDEKILNPLEVVEKTSTKESEAMGKLLLNMMLPFFLMIYSIIGPIAAATDLGAGEKERGTLEPLLSTKADRISLLWGKFLAITVMGLLTTVAFLGGFGITLLQKNSFFGSMGSSNMTIEPKAILILCLGCLVTTMVFGALELSISIYSKSFKEAQTYSSPIIIIGMIPCFLVYMADVKNIKSIYFNIPVTNIMSVMKEALAGIYNINHLIIVLIWSAIYISLSILAAAYMFSREDVIFRT